MTLRPTWTSARFIPASPKEFGFRHGVSRQTIISIERGRFDPSLPLAFRLASLFGSTIEDLFIPDDYSSGAPGTSQAPGAPQA